MVLTLPAPVADAFLTAVHLISLINWIPSAISFHRHTRTHKTYIHLGSLESDMLVPLKVLHKYYPDVGRKSPSIGRQGKALRRQQLKRVLQSQLHQSCEMEVSALTTNNGEFGGVQEQCKDAVLKDADTCKTSGANDESDVRSLCSRLRCEGSDRYTLFEEFSKSGLCRLGLTSPHDIDLFGIWKEVHSFTELVGPYWSLRAALGPVVETFILLDRLLFLQEQDGPVDAVICPLFDPALSPRNVAIIARRI